GLLGRQQDRCFLLLRFRQEGATKEMAYNFQRFLVLSQRQLEQLDYVFQDEGGGAGFHVVRTREPVFHQDVHLGLADEVYRQEMPWKEWQLEVYVREGWELFPRLDSAEL